MLHQETAATLVKRGLTRYSAPHDGAGFPIRARRPESVLVGWRVTASAACWLVAGLLTVAVGRDPGSELPDGERFFTISRTTERPVFSRDTQDRRLALALGCELKHAHRLAYAAPFNLEDERLFSPIGINCHLCPRQACSQRAHQPLFIELPIDPKRRGNTRYES